MKVPWLRELLLLRNPAIPSRNEMPAHAFRWAAERASLAVLELVKLSEQQVCLWLLHALITYPGGADRFFWQRFLEPRRARRGNEIGYVRDDGSFYACAEVLSSTHDTWTPCSDTLVVPCPTPDRELRPRAWFHRRRSDWT
jgi:PAS domain-containing protein